MADLNLTKGEIATLAVGGVAVLGMLGLMVRGSDRKMDPMPYAWVTYAQPGDLIVIADARGRQWAPVYSADEEQARMREALRRGENYAARRPAPDGSLPWRGEEL